MLSSRGRYSSYQPDFERTGDRKMLSRLMTSLGDRLDRRFGWQRLPRFLGIFTLMGLRNRLRELNLYDTGSTYSSKVSGPLKEPPNLKARTLDGSYNDLGDPAMGRIGCRFGRNVPLEYTHPEKEPDILQPNPRRVSRELLTRDRFIPAESLNVLAAAWLQFEVHDWFSHGKNERQNPWKVPLQEDDDWPQNPMEIPRTRRDPTADPNGTGPPTFVTADSHWWDGSQIYGSDEKFATELRSGEDGKLKIDESGLLPKELEQHVDLEGVAGNFWLGLGVLHTLFSLEHNAICDRLREEYPSWDDQQLYDRARLVNAAVMAKIHTVEWTPAVIAHPTTRLAMNANWWGLVGQRITKRFGRFGSGEILSGIPGSPTNHHGVPYSLTEEFVAVYRMHPLVPDDYTFRSVSDDSELARLEFRDIGARDTRARLEEFSVASSLYSLGIANPGAITLHNYPKFLQTFTRPNGEVIDLAATDILRVRERGVPRYNQFRELLRLKPARTFQELTNIEKWQQEIKDVYEGDVDNVDMMVGAYAEPLPRGFGFSDTAFRIFILMASRRLKSDRFFTTDYTPEVYTPAGFEWVNQTTMHSVLLRHYPQLEPALSRTDNAFAPWKRVR
jgi:hypothetical protein